MHSIWILDVQYDQLDYTRYEICCVFSVNNVVLKVFAVGLGTSILDQTSNNSQHKFTPHLNGSCFVGLVSANTIPEQI